MIPTMFRAHPSIDLPARIASVAGILAASLFASVAVAQEPTSERTADELEVARAVDRQIAEELWSAKNEQPLPNVDDYVYLRRIFLDLLGYSPTPSQIRQFVANAEPQKRAQIVTQLLDHEDYGENWARYWRDVILSRKSDNRALLVAPSAVEYLRQQLNENVPWDVIARSFVTARGDVRVRGDTAVIMAQGGRPDETVAELSRIFLGIQIQCAQCHDHPTDSWQREQFHELAAFFPRVSLRPVRAGDRRSFTVIGSDYAPTQLTREDRYTGMREHYMPDLDNPSAPGTLVAPKFFVTNQQVSLGTSDRERREVLATWMTAPENPWFAKSIVNRLWAELIGAGFYDAVDDIGPERECVAPKTLDLLTADFVEHGHDLKRLIRVVTCTGAYQRQSRSRSATEPSDFLCSHPQRLRSDQLFRCLVQVLEMPSQQPAGRSRGERGDRLLRDPARLFSSVFGFDPSDSRKELTGSVPQSLLMMNSSRLTHWMGTRRLMGLGRLVRQVPDDRELVHELYLWTLSRPPDDQEFRDCLQYARRISGRDEAFEDILWSLINSAEFMYRS